MRAYRSNSSHEAVMAELDTKQRDKLGKGQFAYVDRKGEEHLPIYDASHVRNGMSRWNQTDFESTAAQEEARKKILRAAEKYDIEVDDDDKIKHPAK
jgi:hypothetical protein